MNVWLGKRSGNKNLKETLAVRDFYHKADGVKPWIKTCIESVYRHHVIYGHTIVASVIIVQKRVLRVYFVLLSDSVWIESKDILSNMQEIKSAYCFLPCKQLWKSENLKNENKVHCYWLDIGIHFVYFFFLFICYLFLIISKFINVTPTNLAQTESELSES